MLGMRLLVSRCKQYLICIQITLHAIMAVGIWPLAICSPKTAAHSVPCFVL